MEDVKRPMVVQSHHALRFPEFAMADQELGQHPRQGLARYGETVDLLAAWFERSRRRRVIYDGRFQALRTAADHPKLTRDRGSCNRRPREAGEGKEDRDCEQEAIH